MRAWMLGLALLLAACGEQQQAEAPKPAEMTEAAVGRYCGMALVEHEGPKGQVFVSADSQPFWFSSARDTLAFTLLPEEPKDIRAIYVTDWAKAGDGRNPPAESWIDARQAFYVIESSAKGGMGQQEAVPFAERAAAESFAGQNGGRVVAFAELPKDYVLGGDTPAVASGQKHPVGEQSEAHGHPQTR